MIESINSSVCYSVILAFMRIKLFIGTVLLAILSLLLLFHSSHITNGLMILPDTSEKLAIAFYLNNGLNLVASVVGIYGLLNNHLNSLKTFLNSLLATAASLAFFLFYSFFFSSSIKNSRNEYLRLMTTYMSSYDWFSQDETSGESGQKYLATNAWDAAQSEGCCGISGFNDWNQFRPPSISQSSYPRSCCSVANLISNKQGPFCADASYSYETKSLFRRGCASTGAEFWRILIIYYLLLVVYQLLLATFTWCYCKQLKRKAGSSFSNGVVIYTNNQQCTPEIVTIGGWPSSVPQQQLEQPTTNFPSPLYPDPNINEYQEKPPSYDSTTSTDVQNKV